MIEPIAALRPSDELLAEVKSCGSCLHFSAGKPLGRCGSPGGELQGFWVHAEAEHPCWERAKA